jgi:hypothetical protein
LCLAALAAFNAVLFHAVLFQGALLAGGDLNYWYYIWKEFFVDSVRQGIFPFWNPYPFCGTPFFHDMQTATLYPPDLLHFLLPMPWSFGVSAFLHTLLAGWGFCFLAGEWMESRFARFYSALLYMSSGFVVTRLQIGEPTMTQAYAWIPFFFLTGKRLFEEPSARRMSLFAIVCALLFLSGHPHLPFLAGQLFALYLVFECIQSLRGGRFFRSLLGPIGALIGGGLLGLLLVAAQAGPFLEFAGYSATRSGGAAYRFAAEGSIPPNLLLLLLFPFFFGDPSAKAFWITSIPYMEVSAYLGVFGLFFAVAAVVLPRKKRTWLWWGAGAVALLLAVGEHTPLHKAFYLFAPGWNRFRNPGRSLLVFTFSGCLLAGLGLESLRRLPGDAVKVYGRRLLIVFGLFCAILAGVTVIVAIEKPQILQAFATSESAGLYGLTGRLDQGYRPETFVSRYDAMLGSLRTGTAYAGLFCVLLALWIWKPDLRKQVAWVFVAVTAFDLLIFGNRFLDIRTHEEWQADYCPESEVIKTFRENGYQGRMLMTDGGLDWRFQPLHRELYPNSPMLFRIRTVRGYSPSIVKPFSEFINLMQGKPAETLPGGLLFLGDVGKMDPLALRVMGVETYLTYDPAPPPFVPVKRFSSGLMLYKRPDALPRCFRAHESGNRWGLEPVAREQDTTRVIESDPNHVTVETDGPEPALLVFSDTAFPGWTAEVNGVKQEVVPAFHAFQAVKVPSGRSRVTWAFRPTHFTLYLCLSALGAVLIGVGFIPRASSVSPGRCLPE